MMLLNGLFLTMQVTLGALLFGLILGFITALMKLSKFRVLRALATVYVTVIRGIPMVVQLMIMYFVVFLAISKNLGINAPALVIAISAFGFNSGAYVAEIFRAGILSVDQGQTEAGRSVGLSSGKTMRLIVLPQAIKNALPALCNEFISLLKETSIMGYIGMMDLTKAGDIIRSRTFSAFFPLLTVALIYLIIVLILTWLLGKLERRLRKSDKR
jgi:His/Glu/Gln/Arg/opine family amino acid ABC transporter permease subunit